MNFKEFQKEYPTEEACLHTIFQRKYANFMCKCGRKKFYKVKGYKRYDCACGKSIHPLNGTIFSKSNIPLKDWFYVMFLFSTSKNGVAALEVQRIMGCTEKTAYRMCKKLRELMVQDNVKLRGTVEADETYYGGTRRSSNRGKKKTPILGVVERGGRIKAKVLENRSEYQITPFLEKHVVKGTRLITDDAPVYRTAITMKRDVINHSENNYVLGDIHTNSIEGFWGQFKNSLKGTYHGVSKTYLQSYLDMFCFYHNHRNGSVFQALMERI